MYYKLFSYLAAYYTILQYTILYSTLLYCSLLYHTILCYTLLYSTILYFGPGLHDAGNLLGRQAQGPPEVDDAGDEAALEDGPHGVQVLLASCWVGVYDRYIYMYTYICMYM